MEDNINFGGLPPELSMYRNSRFVVLPVPYDGTSTWIKGADKGPGAIIEASMNMELYDIETDSEPCEEGIFTDAPIQCDGTPDELSELVEEQVSKHLTANKLVCVVGGEHSVSIGAMRAHKGKDFSVLQLDAHSDMRDEYHGSKCNHACVMARAKEVASVVQVGIRSMDASERDNLGDVFFAHDIQENKNWISAVVSKLKGDVYITIDLDVFDHSQMPSTGTPEPGGLMWYQVNDLLKQVAKHKNIIGFDVVELCPHPDNKAPDFLAAKLIYKTMAYYLNK